MPSSRQLAAILFTDIAGYTAMMQKDEAAALVVVRKYTAVLVETVANYHGKIVNDYGDGNLCTFSSATEAMRCALELQRRLQTEPMVPLRVGLHIGEVIFENEKPFGDGVNVASRIQSLGVANSILFSAEIYSKISNQAEFSTLSLGTFSFKNVIAPMEVFALANEGLVVPAKENMEGKLELPGSLQRDANKAIQELPGDRPSNRKGLYSIASVLLIVLTVFILLNYQKWLPEPELKSIAVLPFKSLSTDPNDQYLADGFYEEIINRLQQQSSLLVISKPSSDQVAAVDLSSEAISKLLNVQYLLMGSLQKKDGDLRISIRLEDASSGTIVNSKTLDRKIGDYFNLQNEVASLVVTDVGLTVSRGLVNFPSTSNFKAFKFLKEAYTYRPTSPNSHKRIEFLEMALKEDSTFLQAWGLLASSHFQTYGNNGDSTNLTSAILAMQNIESLDKDSFIARNTRNLYSYWVTQDYDLVIRQADDMLDVLPYYSEALTRKGHAFRRKGDNQEFLNTSIQTLKINPLSLDTRREMAVTLGGNGQAHEARKYATELKTNSFVWSYYMIAFNCLVLENRFEEFDQLQKEVDSETNEFFTENEKREFKEMKIAIAHYYRREYSEVKPWTGINTLDSAILLKLSGDLSLSRQQFLTAKETFRQSEAKAGSIERRKIVRLNYAIILAALGEPGWEKIFAGIKEGLAPFWHPTFYGSYTYACILAGKNKEAMVALTKWKESGAASPWGTYHQPFSRAQLLKDNPLLDPIRSESGFEELWEGNHLKLKSLKVPVTE